MAGMAGAQVAGREVAIERHLADGEEFQISPQELIQYGRKLFTANWTAQDGGGRPKTNGSGNPIADSAAPLIFPRNFNRISGPEANSCAGCHNLPFVRGGGDIVTNVFVMAQRFDFATFSRGDAIPARGALDERGQPVTLQSIGNSRATIGMFGSGAAERSAFSGSAAPHGLLEASGIDSREYAFSSPLLQATSNPLTSGGPSTDTWGEFYRKKIFATHDSFHRPFPE
jgi:hypothetical protein